MTVRVTTLTAPAGSIGEYYGEQLGGYYGEGGPTGFWAGAGSGVLGLEGTPMAPQITALMAGVHPATGQQLGRRFRENAGDAKKPSARGYDITCSVPKDISVLWAMGSDQTQAEIERAVTTSAMSLVNYLDSRAPIRARGAVRTGAGLAVAVIPEHTSRNGDPNLHVHVVVSSKVQDPETGRWYALDARELKQHQQMLSVLFHRGLEAELSQRLGVRWGTRTQAFAAPLAGMDAELCALLSSRTGSIDQRLALKMARFEEDLGRKPSPQEAWRLKREAAAESRPSKTSIDETAARPTWHRTAEQVGGRDAVLAAVQAETGASIELTDQQYGDIARAALAELSEQRSTWRRGHLVTEIARMVPSGVSLSAERIVRGVNAMADALLAEANVAAVGSADDVVTQMYTTQETLEEELAVVGWAAEAVEPFPGERKPSELKERVASFADRELAGGQLDAAVAAAGDGQFEIILGPAGTGKTTALKAAVASMLDEGRSVFGLAPSGVAAQVLADETRCTAENVTKFLWEHTQRDTGPLPQFQLPAGATLLVDEAGMVRTSDWSRLCALADENDWRIVAVGDGFQFSAVGRGGMFEHLSAVLPNERVTQLDRVHRFVNEWEAQASLKLRRGDASGLAPYFDHGRCVNVETPPEALKAITSLWAHYEAAGEEVAVFCARNEIVDVINGEIQKHRRAAGLVSSKETIMGRSHRLGVGDQIVARQNERGIVTDRDRWVRNRDRFTITEVRSDGVWAEGSAGSVMFPADYVKAHIELGYSQTSHAGQGRTVDHSLLVIDQSDALDRAGVYVPLTRGRSSNRVLSVSGQNPPSTYLSDLLTEALQRRSIDAPAISHIDADDPKSLTAAARETIDHIAARLSQARSNRRRRFHPLHVAREKRLTKKYEEAWARRNALAVRAAGSEGPAQHGRPGTAELQAPSGDPDLGLDL